MHIRSDTALVNYGPEPRELVEQVIARATVVVRGNHDHAVAHDDDSRWTPRYRAVAEATRGYTSSVLSAAQKQYLRGRPLQAQVERGGVSFHLTHASPSNPPHGSCLQNSEEWVGEVEAVSADVLLVGHTHAPFLRRIGNWVLLNPGSLRQPRTGSPVASYAVWQDGKFNLRFCSPPPSPLSLLPRFGELSGRKGRVAAATSGVRDTGALA